MAVNAKLGVVRKVGAELQKERPEVLVDAIKIVVVDHGRRLHDPRIGRAGTRAAPTLRAHNPPFFLCLADVQHTFRLPELAQIPLGNVVLALPFSKEMRSMPSAATNCSILRTKAPLIGATAVVDANRWPW